MNSWKMENVTFFDERPHLAQHDECKHTTCQANFLRHYVHYVDPLQRILKLRVTPHDTCSMPEILKSQLCLQWHGKFLASLNSLCGITIKKIDATCDTARYMQTCSLPESLESQLCLHGHRKFSEKKTFLASLNALRGITTELPFENFGWALTFGTAQYVCKHSQKSFAQWFYRANSVTWELWCHVRHSAIHADMQPARNSKKSAQLALIYEN